ncbi:adhesion G protein-coupled receptor F5-like [Chanodichthys erythropterus]|uniref:adhesion G protein-coupled receptor F5-like n=1 Tax=Chanodichthys erythropterus TaxID=933992 RepID=UPI00351ED640
MSVEFLTEEIKDIKGKVERVEQRVTSAEKTISDLENKVQDLCRDGICGSTVCPSNQENIRQKVSEMVTPSLTHPPKPSSSSASPLLSPFNLSAPPVDLPWVSQSSAPPWPVDPSAPHQAFKPCDATSSALHGSTPPLALPPWFTGLPGAALPLNQGSNMASSSIGSTVGLHVSSLGHPLAPPVSALDSPIISSLVPPTIFFSSLIVLQDPVEYIIVVEMNVSETVAINEIRSSVTAVTLPVQVDNGTEITALNISTVCSLNQTQYQCKCEDLFVWPNDTCHSYEACDVITDGSCTCINGLPTDGQFCQVLPLPLSKYEYETEIDVSVFDLFVVNYLRSLIRNVSLPLTLSNSINVTDIDMTTVCGLNETVYECKCEEHHVWPNDTCRAYQVCDGIVGGTCGCIQALPSEGPLCQRDIDECQFSPSVCGPNSTCINELGSYNCSCSGGFIATNSNLPISINNTCTAPLSEFKFETEIDVSFLDLFLVNNLRKLIGNISLPLTLSNSINIKEIDMTTVCGLNETVYECKCEEHHFWPNDTCRAYQVCDGIVGGTCGCIQALPSEGPLCQRDIDECQFSPSVCGPNSTCTNQMGSYSCLCSNGFTATNSSLPISINNTCTAKTIQRKEEYGGNVWGDANYKSNPINSSTTNTTTTNTNNTIINTINTNNTIIINTIDTYNTITTTIINNTINTNTINTTNTIINTTNTIINNTINTIINNTINTNTINTIINNTIINNTNNTIINNTNNNTIINNKKNDKCRPGSVIADYAISATSNNLDFTAANTAVSESLKAQGIILAADAFAKSEQTDFTTGNLYPLQKLNLNCTQPDFAKGPIKWIVNNKDPALDNTRYTLSNNNSILTVKNTSESDSDYECSNEELGLGKTNDEKKGICRTGYIGTITYRCEPPVWTKVQDNCIVDVIFKLKNTAETLLVDDIPEFMANLSSATSQNNVNITESPATVQAIVDILFKIANLSQDTVINKPVMESFLKTVNIIVSGNVSDTWNTLNKGNTTENTSIRLLSSIEKISDRLKDEFTINETSIQLNRTTIKNSFSITSTLPNSTTEIVIPQVPNETTVTIIIFTTLDNVLPTRDTNNDSRKSDVLINGDVVVVKVNQTINNISFAFDITNQSLGNPQCVFWNFSLDGWDSTGCEVKPSVNETGKITCECNHTTSFSILMSPFSIDNKALAYITYIGVAISMASLVICLIIETIVWKSVRRNDTSYMRHVTIVNIAVSLLIANICFIIGAAITDQEQPPSVGRCSPAVFFMHFFYLALFFWMLISALFLFYRTVMVLSQMSRVRMMAIAFIISYGSPLLIAVITVASTAGPQKYISQRACWLNWDESKALLAFVIPALTIVAINLVVLIVVLYKMLRRGVGATTQPDEKHALVVIFRCVAILTPIFGLTWGLGIGTMVSRDLGVHVVFTILNSLQGFFILVFGTLLDNKVRESLPGKLLLQKLSSSNTKSTSAGSSSTSGLGTLFQRMRQRSE